MSGHYKTVVCARGKRGFIPQQSHTHKSTTLTSNFYSTTLRLNLIPQTPTLKPPTNQPTNHTQKHRNHAVHPLHPHRRARRLRLGPVRRHQRHIRHLVLLCRRQRSSPLPHRQLGALPLRLRHRLRAQALQLQHRAVRGRRAPAHWLGAGFDRCGRCCADALRKISRTKPNQSEPLEMNGVEERMYDAMLACHFGDFRGYHIICTTAPRRWTGLRT